MIEFSFNIRKTLAAVGYICSLNAGKADVLKLIKILYIADRWALISWQRTITGDKMASMKNGPVLSITYDLIKHSAQDSKSQDLWNQYVAEREGNTVQLKRMPDLQYLSVRECESLSKAFEKVRFMSPVQLISWLHRSIPEWKDPGSSSKPIDPKDILVSETLMTDQEISVLEEELEHLRFADSVLTTE